MRAKRSKGLQWATARKLGLALLSAGVLAGAQEAPAQAPPSVGVACTTSGAPTDTARTFTLTTRTGYVSVPDGTSTFMWGYAAGGGAFQHPGPVLCVNQGDTVTVVLNNTFANDDVSIMFPGQEGVLADGAPAQPQFDGTGALMSLTKAAPRNGGQRHLQFRRREARYLRVRERDRAPDAGPDGAVRCPGGAAEGGWPGGARPGQRPARQRVRRGRGVHGAALRDRSPPARGRPAAASLQHEQLPAAVLVRERPRVPRQHRRQLRELSAEPAIRRPGEDPSEGSHRASPG